MLNDTSRLRLAEDVTYQSLGSDEATVILSLHSGQLYTCNETTRVFLDALGGGVSTFEELLNRLYDQYDVSREKLRRDMVVLAEDLIQAGIVVILP